MTTATDHAEVITTLPECPAWCPGCEGFDENRRNHELPIGSVTGENLDSDDGSAVVSLFQAEKIVGRDVVRDPVELTLTVGGNDVVAFTPAAARELADALVRGAARLEKVQA